MKKIIILFSFTFILLNPGIAQTEIKKFLSLQFPENAGLNQTNTMLQDSTGYIWFGTIYGLVRFDGIDYTIYVNDKNDSTSISFNDIISLHADRKGNLWIGTRSGGLNFLPKNSDKFTRYIYTPENYLGISDNIIRAITEDTKGNIWIATGTGMLNRYNRISGKFKRIEIFKDSSFAGNDIIVNSIFCENQYSIWIGHDSGIIRFDPQTEKTEFYNLRTSSLDNKELISVQSISKDNFGSLWIGTSSGLFRFNRNENEFYIVQPMKNFVINSIQNEADGKLWCGTNNGIVIYNTETGSQEIITAGNSAGQIPGNFVKEIFKDKSGVMWVNCYQSGIAKYHPDFSRFTSYNFSPLNVNSIIADENSNIYAAVSGDGIYKLFDGNAEFEKLKIENNKVQFASLLQLVENKLIMPVPGELIVYDLKSKKTVKDYFPKNLSEFAKQVDLKELLIDGKNSYWMSTKSGGVYFYNTEKDTLISFTPLPQSGDKSTPKINTLYKDNQNKIWIGTYNGAFCYDMNGSLLKAYTHDPESEKSISSNYVFSIYQDTKNNLWIGTAFGLNKLNKQDESFLHYHINDGLPAEVVKGILEDNSGSLWISTNNGISRFNPAKNEFINFSSADGLQNNIFFSGPGLMTNNGKIFFAGMNGIVSCDLNYIKVNQFRKPAVITSVKMIDSKGQTQLINPDHDNLNFSYYQNSFLIKVSSFDYKNPHNCQYKYKIENYTKGWVNLDKNNSFTISNLPPGNYKLLVQSTNSNGTWSTASAEFLFTVSSPYWQTWWFWFILFSVLLFLLLITYRLTIYFRVNKELGIEKSKLTENDKTREQTAIDFHNELGNRLTRISLLTEIIKRKLNFTFSDISPLLEQISENSSNLYNGAKDFIWSIDRKKDNLYELMLRLKDFGDEVFDGSEIKFWVNEPDENLMTANIDMRWKRSLMLIFKEGISNSLKHSNSTLVILDTKLNRNEFEIILEDNGRGFKSDEIKSGNGIKNMKHFAELLQLKLNIDSEPGRGTRISLKGNFPAKSVNLN